MTYARAADFSVGFSYRIQSTGAISLSNLKLVFRTFLDTWRLLGDKRKMLLLLRRPLVDRTTKLIGGLDPIGELFLMEMLLR